jgi:predicted permease
MLVGGQVAISLVLLMVAAVLAEGYRADLLRGPGFRTSGLFLSSFNTSILRYGDAQRDQFYMQLLDRMRLAEGVRSAAPTSGAPMSLGFGTMGIVPEGYMLKPGQEAISIFDSVVSDGYFETLGIPIVRGRGFRDSDRADTPAVAVVNEHLAQRFWPGQDPLGKRFHLHNGAGTRVEIVGIARNAKYISIIEAPTDFLYLPFVQNRQAQMTLVAESQSNDPAVLAPVFRRVVQDLDRNMPVFDARSMSDLYENRSIKSANLVSETVGSLAAMGLVLAIVGLCALVAFSVSRRKREFGIRLAVGADRGGVTRLVLKQALTLGAVGVTAGFGIGIFACRAITSQIFVNGMPMGMLPPVGVAVLLILTITAAAWLPARRAGRIDPMQALRDE